MTNAHRDLASPELWTRSTERSRRRRELLPKGRREHNRKKHVSAVLATAVVAGPTAPIAAAQVSGDVSTAVAAESPANRAIEIREGGLPLQFGSEGELVAHVQKALEISADGIFGAETDAAVRSYQQSHGLDVDGIVGLATWGALFEQNTASGASVGGSNVPPEVQQRLEQTLERAGQDLSADGQIDGDVGVGGTQPGSAPPASAPAPGTVTGPQSAPAPVGGGEACGSSTIANPLRGTVTSNFGPRWGRTHEGMDIAAPTGTPVRAAACGTVSLAGQQGGYGNMVCITHTSQFSTCYAHLSRFGVSSGAQVRQGQVIGYVGCTGSCTGPHTHFETRVGGKATNPRTYLGGSSIPGTRASAAGTSAVGGPDLPRELLEQRRAGVKAAAEGAATSSGGVAFVPTEEFVAETEAAYRTDTTTESSTTTEAETGGETVTTAPETAPAEPVAVETEVAVPAEPVAVETEVAAPVEPVAVETEVAAPAEPVAVEAEVAAPAEPVAVEAEVAAPVEPVAVETEVAAPAEPVEPAPVEPVAVEAAPAAEVAPVDAEVSAETSGGAVVAPE